MNREETLALYEQGVEAWNKWANEMLEERKSLEEAGKWETKGLFGDLAPANEVTKIWVEKAEANFSSEEHPHTFEQGVSFSNLIFPSETSFHSATFNGYAWFDTATFNGEALFDTATFNGNASFITATFNGEASFTTATFNEITSFDTATFNGEAWFTTATFNGNASFTTATFNGNASFTTATFKERAWFVTATFNGYTAFMNAKFEREAEFNAIRSESAFTLEGTQFKSDVPNFIQAHFEEAPRLDHIDLDREIQPGGFMSSILSPVKSDVKARYQALKRLAIQAHDHENEQLFWAGEMRSNRSLRRPEPTKAKWKKLFPSRNALRLFSPLWWGNIAYGLVSDYGRSVSRPFITWAFIVLTMMVVHLSTHFDQQKQEAKTNPNLTAYQTNFSSWVSKTVNEKGTPPFELKGISDKTCDPLFASFHLSIKKGLLVLGWDASEKFTQDYACLYGVNKQYLAVEKGGEVVPIIPNNIVAWQMIQTLLSAILIFLFLLGLRNNFKLK